MSHNVHTEIRENVSYLGGNDALTEADEQRDEQLDAMGPHEKNLPPLVVAGWKGPEESDGKLIIYKMKRKSFTVNVVNSSQYSNVGEREWTVYGPKPAVNAFLADLGLSTPIKKQGVVESWY